MEIEAAERVVKRRERLQYRCHVDPIKQHLRLQLYYEIARQLYRQAEGYYHTHAWDEAYISLARFIKLCSKVIPSHKDYSLPQYEKERLYVNTQAVTGLSLFDAILDGMEREELSHLQMDEEMFSSSPQHQHKKPSSIKQPKSHQKGGSKDPLAMTLEERLEALKKHSANLRPSAPSLSNVQDRFRNLQVTSSAPSAPLYASSSVAYPSVGKASWIPGGSSPSSASNMATSIRDTARNTGFLHRTLVIPSSLIAQFSQIAEPNTLQLPDGVETCGILAGRLLDKKLQITTLIVPKQEGSSDMCSMTHEEELFDYCFSHDLLTLGWIHTHPSQTCFLSSVDIHTQCGFQSILPEAVAIVVAPRDYQKNVGVFRLTEPNGLELIQNCTLTGFHQHPEHIEIYSDAIACEWTMNFHAQVVDMRNH